MSLGALMIARRLPDVWPLSDIELRRFARLGGLYKRPAAIPVIAAVSPRLSPGFF
jgi:hypothetical protein